MTQDTPSYPLRQAPVHSEPVYVAAPAVDDEQPTSPIKVLRRALHGRYVLTGVLCVLLGGAGAIGGWSIPKPIFMSWGAINVKPTQGFIMYPTEKSALQPMYKQVVGSIAQQVMGDKEVTRALRSPEWVALDHPEVPMNVAIEEFRERITTIASNKSTIVSVEFRHPDPTTAMVGVNVLMKAFWDLYTEQGFKGGSKTIDILEDRRGKLMRTIESLKTSVFAYSDEKGPDAIRNEYMHNINSRSRLEERTEELRLEIASLQSALESASADRNSPDREPKTAQEISLVDGKLAFMLEREETIESSIYSLKHIQGYGAKDPRVLTENHALKAIRSRIERYVTAYNSTQGGTVDVRSARLESLRDELGRVVGLLRSCEVKIETLGRTIRRMDTLESEIAMNETRLNEVKYRIQTLDVESQVDDRVVIQSHGTLPSKPDNDKRFAIATGGGLGGILLAFGVMVLIGLSNQRVRNLVDMDYDTSSSRFLGILPELPGSDATPDERGIAEHCIHNVRTLLQLHTQHSGAVTVVTSATANAGKTTLSAALGLSFAATGGRTLLVDADMVGRGLTSSVKAFLRQRIIRMLEEGDVDGSPGRSSSDDLLSVLADAQKRGDRGAMLGMDELFDRARRFRDASGERSAEIQRMLQVLQGQEVARDRRGGASTGEIRRTILAGSGVDARSAGILEALCGAPLRDCVVRTGIPNLHVLTAGGADARDAGTLAPEAVMALLNTCTQEYDHIVLDTGPILGSLEASILCAQADAVLLTVSRGDERSLTVRALERLSSVHAKVAGIVFNRADMGEVRRSNFSSQLRSDQVEVV